MRPVACIRNEEGETFGVVAHVLREQAIPWVDLDAWTDALPEPDEVSAYAVFGGDQHIHQIERDPYLISERDLIRRAVDAGRPVLGICLGAQLLAAAMGARVRPAPRRQCRFAPFRPTPAAAGDPLFSVFADEDPVFHWHEDTFDVPGGAELLSRSDQIEHQSFRVGAVAWGSQFHFEVTESDLEMWIRAAGPAMERRWGRSGQDLLEEARRHLGGQERSAREVVRRFVRLAADGVPGDARARSGSA